MPRNGSVGYSDNTPIKQEHLRVLLRTHMPIVKSIMQKRWVEPCYLYLDLNAGKGRYAVDGAWLYGSPLIACAVAQAFDVPLQAVLCERDHASLRSLRRELITFGFASVPDQEDLYHNHHQIMASVCPGDYEVSARDFLAHLQQHTSKERYGLLYSDENGSCPPFALLSEYARTLPYLDIVIHLAASPIKWQRVSTVHPFRQRLDELMSTIQKTYWLIRDPYGHHQWTFLIGTNWPAFPKFRKQGFWPIDSPEGASILRRLSWTTKERQAHLQGNLFAQEEL